MFKNLKRISKSLFGGVSVIGFSLSGNGSDTLFPWIKSFKFIGKQPKLGLRLCW